MYEHACARGERKEGEDDGKVDKEAMEMSVRGWLVGRVGGGVVKDGGEV